jgi:hypothetical protein
MDQFPDSKEGTSIRDFSRLSLTTTVLSSLTLFFSHGEDRLKVAAARNLAETTIVGHLSEAIKQGTKKFSCAAIFLHCMKWFFQFRC